MPLGIGRGSGVAVVEMHGVIGSQIRPAPYSRIFEGVARNKSYRALLLDIDSPGGSASASESLHRSIERVAEVKPVYAYVRGMGASGGYYLCCAASRVFALPTAMVGSIGVIFLRPVLEAVAWKGRRRILRLQGREIQGHDRVLAQPDGRGVGEATSADRRNLRQLRAGRIQGQVAARRVGAGAGNRRGDDRPASHRRRLGGRDRRLCRRACRGRSSGRHPGPAPASCNPAAPSRKGCSAAPPPSLRRWPVLPVACSGCSAAESTTSTPPTSPAGRGIVRQPRRSRPAGRAAAARRRARWSPP